MIRRVIILSLALLLGACAAKAPRKPEPMASIPPAPPRGEPGQYINMATTALEAVFGKPAFVRKDGVTEMWRYDGAACRAFFFLYGKPLAVRHVETLPHGSQSAWDGACLMDLSRSPARTS